MKDFSLKANKDILTKKVTLFQHKVYQKRRTKIIDIQSVNVTVHTAEQSDRQKETLNNNRQTQNRIKPPNW